MSLKAGICTRNISPKKPTFLVGYPHYERISTGIHDPLLASALYLQNGETGIILVAVDILQIDPQTARELRKAISHRADLPESHIFISCTHTHSGPVTMDMLAWQDDPVVPKADPEYMEYFKKSIIEAALEAKNSIKPVEIARTTTQAKGVGGNRLSPDGISDPEVGILVVRDAVKKSFIALSIIYSMHPTVLHEDSTLVSADFPVYTRIHLKEHLDSELTVLYHTGPAGNQSPRYSVKAQTFEEAERLGRTLGQSVLESVKKLHDADFKSDFPLAGEIAPVNLPPRNMPSLAEANQILRQRIDEYKRLKNEGASRGVVRTAECAVFGAEETVVLARSQKNGKLAYTIRLYSPAEVQVLRIGDCFLVGLPGEVFVEYGLQIKSQAPCKTFVVSLVNGDLQGYIVTPEAKISGSYEASNSLFKPESGRIMIETALKIIYQIG